MSEVNETRKTPPLQLLGGQERKGKREGSGVDARINKCVPLAKRKGEGGGRRGGGSVCRILDEFCFTFHLFPPGNSVPVSYMDVRNRAGFPLIKKWG